MARKGQTVTRYSHNPLAKKFKCPQCGNWFRTLQGLSGHIRFKHGVYEKQDDIVDKFPRAAMAGPAAFILLMLKPPLF